MNPAFLGAYLITILNQSPSEASYASCHPRNWPAIRKAWIIGILVFLEFFVTIIATTGSAAVHYAVEDFPDDSKKALMASFVSTYSFGQAVGSILLPQFTEPFGRRQFYLWSTVAFSVTCVVTGVTPSIVGVGFGRFVGGLASAVPAVVVAGSVEDLFNEKSRIWLIWLWNCLTVAGQVLGPVYSTYIAGRLGWYVETRTFSAMMTDSHRPWVYYVAAIITAAMLPLIFLTPETRHFKVLEKNAPKNSETDLNIQESHNPDAHLTLVEVLWRPTVLLFTEPLVFVATALSSFSMGLIYLFTEALHSVYTSPGFDFSYEKASLPFLAMMLGIFFSIVTRIHDMHRYKRHSALRTSTAELKLAGCLLGAPALAIGLWVFSWTIPPAASHISPVVSMIGLTLLGFAATEIAYCLQGYLTDAYTAYASSALSGLACIRAVVSGVLPLVAGDMFQTMGNNNAGTLLAALATLFSIGPVAFYFIGEKLRARSPFARVSTIAASSRPNTSQHQHHTVREI